MKMTTWTTACSLLLALLITGCNQEKTKESKTGKTDSEKETKVVSDETKKHDDHSGWWCNEHGVPEGECALCSSKIAAKFQKKGDWCKEHNRPESQCFICKPELAATFAAKYKAKYGKNPPKPEE